MGFFDFLKTPDINLGVAQFSGTPNAILLDVRTPAEYAGGHIPHSQNLPLQELEKISKKVPNQNTPLFVYCQSGARSKRAVAILQEMGYQNITNIGGISTYRGTLEG